MVERLDARYLDAFFCSIYIFQRSPLFFSITDVGQKGCSFHTFGGKHLFSDQSVDEFRFSCTELTDEGQVVLLALHAGDEMVQNGTVGVVGKKGGHLFIPL